MSYEQLMQHAAEIERLAVKGALEQKGFVYDPHGNPHAPTDIGEQGARDIADMTAKEFSDVQSMFAPFASMPDPNAFGGMRDDMLAAMRELSTGQTPTDPITGLGLRPTSRLMRWAASATRSWTGTGGLPRRSS
jgi:hypothetical protein